MKYKEIKAKDLKPKKFIDDKVREVREIAGDGIAISALSGGVDSSVVTALAHRALGKKLKTYFIDNGIMREGEPKKVKALFAELGIPVTIVDARKAFFDAMKGITDPELKTGGHHADLLQKSLPRPRAEKQGHGAAAGDDPHRCRGDGRRDQAPAQCI